MAKELHDSTNAPLEPANAEPLAMGQPPEQEAPPNLRERASQAVEGYRAWAEKYPFAATAVETVVVFAAKRAVSFAGDKVGLSTRNALEEDHLETAKKHPLKAAAHLVVIAPIAEELQFRGPSWLRRQGDRKSSKILGTVMLLGFAAAHAGVVRPAENWTKPPFVKVGTKNVSMPVVPLMGGANYARLSERRGFIHGVFAHALNNAIEGAAAIPEVQRRRSNKL